MTPRMTARNIPITILTSTIICFRERINEPREPLRKSDTVSSQEEEAPQGSRARNVPRWLVVFCRILSAHCLRYARDPTRGRGIGQTPGRLPSRASHLLVLSQLLGCSDSSWWSLRPLALHRGWRGTENGSEARLRTKLLPRASPTAQTPPDTDVTW
jgi:hypothetical protein